MRGVVCNLGFALAVAWAAIASMLTGCGYSPDGDIEQVVTSQPDGTTVPQKRPLRVGGYTAGTLHPKNVDTVCVEIFASQEFRREVEFRLTEAVGKRILSDTPYKLAKRNNADTVLYGEITSIPVTVLSTGDHWTRENQILINCNWTWKDRRTGEILAQRKNMQQTAEYIPPAGETFFDASEIAINRLAERIIEGMEADW